MLDYILTFLLFILVGGFITLFPVVSTMLFILFLMMDAPPTNNRRPSYEQE